MAEDVVVPNKPKLPELGMEWWEVPEEHWLEGPTVGLGIERGPDGVSVFASAEDFDKAFAKGASFVFTLLELLIEHEELRRFRGRRVGQLPLSEYGYQGAKIDGRYLLRLNGFPGVVVDAPDIARFTAWLSILLDLAVKGCAQRAKLASN